MSYIVTLTYDSRDKERLWFNSEVFVCQGEKGWFCDGSSWLSP